MKKVIILILALVLTTTYLIGCGKSISQKNLNQKNNASTSNIEERASQKTENIKKVGDPEKMDDSQFLSTPLQGEEPIKLDEVDSTIAGLGDLDTLINTNDPIADIPTK